MPWNCLCAASDEKPKLEISAPILKPEDRNKLQIITPLKSSSLPQTPKRKYEQQQQQQQQQQKQQAATQEQQLLLQQQELQLFQQRKQHLFNRSYSSDCERNSSGSDVNNASIKRKHLTKTKKLQRSASETAATSVATVPTAKELTSTLKGSIKSRSSTRKHPANVKFSFDDNDTNNNNVNNNADATQPENGNVSDISKKDEVQSGQTIGNYDELPLLVSLKTRRSNSVCGVHQYATINEPFNRIPLPPRRNNSHENLFSTTIPYIDDDINHTYTTLQPQPYIDVVTTAPTSVTSLHNERFITLHPQNVASVQTLAKNYYGKEPEKYVQQTSLYDVTCYDSMPTCYDLNGNGGNEPTTTTNTVTTTQSEQLPPAPQPQPILKRNPTLGMMGKSFAIIQEEIEIPPENSHNFQFHMPAKGKICQVCHEPLLNEIRNVVKCGDCDLTCHGWCVSMIVERQQHFFIEKNYMKNVQ